VSELLLLYIIIIFPVLLREFSHITHRNVFQYYY